MANQMGELLDILIFYPLPMDFMDGNWDIVTLWILKINVHLGNSAAILMQPVQLQERLFLGRTGEPRLRRSVENNARHVKMKP